MTLLEALRILYPNSSNTTLRDWIKLGRIQVGDEIIRIPSTECSTHQNIRVLPEAFSRRSYLSSCSIVYEDKDVVIVNKKAGALSVATDYEKTDTVHSDLKKIYQPRKIFVVHRLDQGTSGLLMFARNEKAYLSLKKQLEARTMKREYIAIVKGKMETLEGTWRSHLYEDANYKMHSTQDPEKGEEAVTHFKAIARRSPYSILHAKLETGKKNQIRVQCADAGIPIAGDERYGGETKSARRLMLHAFQLEFKHPLTGKKMQFNCPIPLCFSYFVPPSLWIKAPLSLEKPHGKK